MSTTIEFAREIERIQKQAGQKTKFNGWYQCTWVNAQMHMRTIKRQGSA